MLSVTMTPEAAERFKAALSYADAVCEGMADANAAPTTAEKIREHADWLRWGIGRIAVAKVNAA